MSVCISAILTLLEIIYMYLVKQSCLVYVLLLAGSIDDIFMNISCDHDPVALDDKNRDVGMVFQKYIMMFLGILSLVQILLMAVLFSYPFLLKTLKGQNV